MQAFRFVGTIKHVPGLDHFNPTDYAIVQVKDTSYGLYDLNLAIEIPYIFSFENGKITITNENDKYITDINVDGADTITLFKNMNGKIEHFVLVNNEGDAVNITIENTIKKYLPGAIKSPIVVMNNNLNEPLDLSGSYRWYYKNGEKFYFFTNTEREYFKPNYKIKVDSPILDKLNTVTIYGIKKKSHFILDELLHIPSESKDTIDFCADAYDVLFESDFHSINKSTGEIRLDDVDDYQMLIVDYIKDNSYCVNYRYEMNSFEIDIAVSDDEDISMYYDNIIQYVSDDAVQEYISSKKYFDTKLSPDIDGYIVIGGDKIS